MSFIYSTECEIHKPLKFMNEKEREIYCKFNSLKNELKKNSDEFHECLNGKDKRMARCLNDKGVIIRNQITLCVEEFENVSGELDELWSLYIRFNPDRKKELLNRFFDGKYNGVATV